MSAPDAAAAARAAEAARGRDRARAALLLLCGVAALSFQDSLVKLMSDRTSLWQFQVLRSTANLGFVVLLAGLGVMGSGLAMLWPRRLGWVAVRSLLLAACMAAFFGAAPVLSVAQMGSGLYTYPMFVTLLSGLVLGEPVGPWRMGAAAVSALGGLLILSPWEDSFVPEQLLPVLAGFLYACNILVLRRNCREESPLALAFAAGICFLTCGMIGIAVLETWPASETAQAALPYLTIGWPELTWLVVGFALLASVCNLSGNICLTSAYQRAEPAFLAPFDYSYLAFALVWGLLMFARMPDAQMLLGMAMIGGAGVLTTLREVRRGRRSPSPPQR